MNMRKLAIHPFAREYRDGKYYTSIRAKDKDYVIYKSHITQS